ncbi:MAG: 50S ribosomal protein L22 [Candidatus Omnitrophica bacterium]|nr:50S ribosomal protein L22 [Candidatus Omnitrophota bacterium]
MIAKAQGKFLRGSSMKVNQVLDLIRGKDVATSLAILTHMNKGPNDMLKKLLNSAVSNARQKGLDETQLYISRIVADKGPMWKRFRAGAFGRAMPILKRTVHVTIELDLMTPSKV